MKIEVKENDIRLDKYVSLNSDYSRSTIEKMLDESYILVNDKIEKASYKVKEGDVITIKDGFVKETNVVPKEMDIDVVYEDDYLMVINKPSGLVVHPGAGNYDNTLVNGLLNYTNLAEGEDETRPGIVHRIDKDTSGLLLVAKDEKAEEILINYFKNKEVHREYVALLVGEFPHDEATIDAPIGRDPKNRKRMCVTANNGKKSVTHLKVLKRYKGYTLVKCVLETGRTHQIRVHMAYIGYPVYNDPVYGHSHSEFGQFLHSAKMDFIHPVTHKEMHFECPIPTEFQEFLDTLDK
jgi:23S rRNA pseudouridine1911/1915/1917 synthase